MEDGVRWLEAIASASSSTRRGFCRRARTITGFSSPRRALITPRWAMRASVIFSPTASSARRIDRIFSAVRRSGGASCVRSITLTRSRHQRNETRFIATARGVLTCRTMADFTS